MAGFYKKRNIAYIYKEIEKNLFKSSYYCIIYSCLLITGQLSTTHNVEDQWVQTEEFLMDNQLDSDPFLGKH